MAQVAVTIAGRVYRMACAEGEEAHLEGLAAELDRRISEMRGSFGEIGDQRLTVMAAIALADELGEARAQQKALRGEMAAMKQAEDMMAQAVERMAGRVERFTQELNAMTARD